MSAIKPLYQCIIFGFTIFIGQIVIAKYIAHWIPAPQLGMPAIEKFHAILSTVQINSLLYFGDSTIRDNSPADKDKSSIAAMIELIDPRLHVADASSLAYHLGVFEAMTERVCAAPIRPRGIIIPINLRSFSPEWDRRPEYQFDKEIFYLRHSDWIYNFSRPLEIFHAIGATALSEKAFYAVPVYNDGVFIGSVGGFETEGIFPVRSAKTIRNFYLYDYSARLSFNHRKMLSLGAILAVMRTCGITPYVYVTPVDYEGGVRYAGSSLKKIISENAKIACSVALQAGFSCLNLATALPSAYFTHAELPNEHLNEYGRRSVAKALAHFIRQSDK